ncbi:MAG: ABC transporter ATP-binding protein [Treponema sp.]|nr:ABC transporter ATP-binding protein [Treponema sp.]
MEENKLCVHGISAFYGDRQILSNVDFTLNPGELVCLIGKNGAGKTTFLKVLAGLYNENLRIKYENLVKNEKPVEYEKKRGIFQKPPHTERPRNERSGRTARVEHPFSERTRRTDYKKNAQKTAFLLQSEWSTWNYTVFDFVLQGRFCHTNSTGSYSKHDFMVTEKALERLQISFLRDARVHEISGGEFQKVRLARCIAQEPKFFLLDEPLSNLDFSYEDDFIQLLRSLCREEHCGILMSVHDLNLASRYGDRIALINAEKRLFTGTVSEVMVPSVLEPVYCKKIHTFTHPDGSIQVYSAGGR